MKIIYIANCIEDRERFTSIFQTSETDKEKLYAMGQELAMGWGAECISVSKWKPKTFVSVFDKKDNKWIEDTQKKWDNFIKKNPNSTRYDYSTYKSWVEKQPIDIWDMDKTDIENLAFNKHD